MNSYQPLFDNNNFQYDTSAYDYRTIEELRYAAKRNLIELVKLINRLFDHHSRILVVRIDLRYRKEASKTISLETVQFHRKLLLEDRRSHPEVFAGLLGYSN